MITRSDFMEKRATFQEYYLDVARAAGITKLPSDLMVRVRNSADPHLNDIPLMLWDGHASMRRSAIHAALKDRGDFYSDMGGVCTLKAVARAMRDGEGNA